MTKENNKMKKNLIISVLLIGMFLLSFANAAQFDNVKEKNWNKELKQDFKTDKIDLKYNKIWDKYEPITVKNAFGLGKTLFEGAITEHTATCNYDSCYSIMDVYSSGDNALVDNVYFETIKKDGSRVKQNVRSYQFYISTEGEQFLVDDYETVCIDLKQVCNQTVNGTQCSTPQSCTKKKVGSHYEEKPIWSKYTIGDKMPSGEYKLKLEAKIKIGRTVDWIIETNGEKLTSWAEWSAGSLQDGLVAYYSLNESSGSVRDISMTGHEGHIGNAFKFDEEKNYVTLADGLSTNIATSDEFSFSIWVKKESDTSGSDQIFLALRKDVNVMLYWESNTDSLVGYVGTNNGVVTLDAEEDLPNDWTLITLTSSKTAGQKLYIDNVEKDSNTAVYTSLSAGGGQDNTIGIKSWDYTQGQVNGLIDEVMIFDDALTSGEISTIYNSGAGQSCSEVSTTDLVSCYTLDEVGSDPLDAHGSNDGELSGGTNNGATRGVDGKIEKAFDFDGSNDYISGIPDALIPNDGSACAWIKTTVVGEEDVFYKLAPILDSEITTTGADDWAFGIDDNGKIAYGNGGGSTDYTISSSTTVNTGNWMFVCFTRVKSTGLMKVYVNGIENGSATGGTTTLDGTTSDGYTLIGKQHWSSGTTPFDGKIDEVGIWDRALNSSEISALWNGGNGLKYDIENSPVTVTLNSPTDSLGSNTSLITFNATAESDDTLNVTNMTLWTNESGTWEIKNTTTGITNYTHTQTWQRNISDGTYIWNVQACDTDGDCGFATSNFSLSIDTTAPTIEILSPITVIDSLTPGENVTLNYSITDTNLDSCWYEYNGTNTTTPCSTNSSFIYELDEYTIILWANDTVSNVGSETITLAPLISVTNETYSDTSYDTTIEEFEIFFDYNSSVYLSLTANIVYNGTNYTGTVTTGDNSAVVNRSVSIPSVPATTDLEFYWEIYLNDGSTIYVVQSSHHNQTVSPLPGINITTDECSAGTFKSLYYDFKDAENLTSMNASIAYNFKFGISSLQNKTVNGEITNTPSFHICINNTISDYKLGYGEIEYVNTGYSSRRYYMYEGQELSNETQANHTLHLLPSASSTSFIFEFKNTFLNPYTNKLVALLRWYPEEDEYRIVEMAKTDDDGSTVMKVHTEDIDYRVGLYDLDGTLLKLADPVRMACLVNPCTYTLKVIHDPIDFDELYNIETSLTWDKDNDRFVFIYNDPSQQTSQMRLHVYRDAGFQEILICNDTASGYTGVLTCGIGNETGRIIAKAYRSASPEWPISIAYHSIRDAVESSFGLFTSFLIVLVSALIGVFSPIASIFLLLVGLIISVFLGSVTFAVAMGLGVLGGIIINVIKNYS